MGKLSPCWFKVIYIIDYNSVLSQSFSHQLSQLIPKYSLQIKVLSVSVQLEFGQKLSEPYLIHFGWFYRMDGYGYGQETGLLCILGQPSKGHENTSLKMCTAIVSCLIKEEELE